MQRARGSQHRPLAVREDNLDVAKHLDDKLLPNTRWPQHFARYLSSNSKASLPSVELAAARPWPVIRCASFSPARVFPRWYWPDIQALHCSTIACVGC